MSCNTCGQTNKCNHVDFALDGTYLVPSLAGIPGDGVDLSNVINVGETDTHLQLDIANNRLIYNHESSISGDSSPDVIPMESIASTISLQDLADVGPGIASTGDILTFNTTTNQWSPYTIPLGDIVSFVGINLDGNIVKNESGGGGGGGDAGVPIGGGYTWDGDPATFPAGMVPKDGRELSRSVYATYFGIIGTKYGVGNGTTTFNIPNMQDRTSVGVGTSTAFNAVGKTFGTPTETLNQSQMPSHTHGVYDPGHTHGTYRDPVVTSPSGNSRANAGSGQQLAWSTGQLIVPASTGISLYATGGSAAHNNIQPSLAEYHLVRII